MSVPLFHTAPLSVAIFFCPSDNLELAAILSGQVQMHRGRVGQNTKEEVIGNLLIMTIRSMESLIFYKISPPAARTRCALQENVQAGISSTCWDTLLVNSQGMIGICNLDQDGAQGDEKQIPEECDLQKYQQTAISDSLGSFSGRENKWCVVSQCRNHLLGKGGEVEVKQCWCQLVSFIVASSSLFFSANRCFIDNKLHVCPAVLIIQR